MARERNTKGIITYKHAYDSLKACPIAFEHPASLVQLRGFGPKLCERLTEKLRQYCEENGLPMPPHPMTKRKRDQRTVPPDLLNDGIDQDDGAPQPKKRRKQRAYVPAYRSGAYAILVALSGIDQHAGMTKSQLIEAAQPYCDASFTTPSDPTKFYTAWNSMKVLQQKELVYEKGRPLKKYCLTDEGWEIAMKIRETDVPKAGSNGTSAGATSTATSSAAAASTSAKATASSSKSLSNSGRTPAVLSTVPKYEPPTLPPKPEVIDLDGDDEDIRSVKKEGMSEYFNVVKNGTTVPTDSELPRFTPIRLMPGTFTVELLLDVREIRAVSDRDYMQQELANLGVKTTVRSLELGDALWIARCKQPGWLSREGAEGDEVVLDWIVERKRLDDLIESIKDGRFHEQKFRLRRSGIQNVIYIVEEITMDPTHFQKYEEAVESAIASMQVVNGYFLKRTQKMDETIRYLADMTKMLKQLYESKPLHVIPTAVLTTKNYLPLMKHLRQTQPSLSHHISYPAFMSLASKSENMMLRDLFLKMLMCTKGLTGEKAIEIQKVWKTPYNFVKAFERCGQGEDGKQRREEMVMTRLSHLVGRKKISKGLSQMISATWGE
jgi:ERCC4-type nuclease